MPFQMLMPEHKVKTGKLTVSCRSIKGGPFRLMLSIPHLVFDQALGKTEKVDMHWGNGVDAGKLKITAPGGGGGHFKPSFLKNCVVIRLPASEDTPDFDMPPIDPEHRQVPDGLMILLPEWAWNRERQKAIRLAKVQVVRERTAEKAGGR